MSVHILQGDVIEQLRTLADESVNCVVTSPPYWGLRAYLKDGDKDKAREIGLERTLGEHIETIVAVFREVRRVLRKDGVVWINYGDAYATSPNGRSAADTKAVGKDDRTFRDKPFSTVGPIGGKRITAGKDRDDVDVGGWGKRDDSLRWRGGGTLKPKDRLMLPARVAIALQDDGWWLRDEIVWHKPNPMPSSVKDRTTPAHEMIYLLSKSRRYWYDAEAIKEPMSDVSIGRLSQPSIESQAGGTKQDAFDEAGLNERGGSRRPNEIVKGLARKLNNYDEKLVAGDKWGARHAGYEAVRGSMTGRNKRSVWTVATEAFPDAHFATFPQELIEPMILAGCPKQCCAKCGAPWVRETRRNVAPPPDRINNNPFKHDVMTTHGEGAHTLRNVVTHETLGWRATCKCEAGTVPGTVLDPFGGSGTTALVADKLGRNAILIELNPEYVAMAARRVYGSLLAPLALTQQAAE